MSISDHTEALWDNPDADVILRSADNVDFRADKLFLVRAFEGFADMFAGDAIGTGGTQEMESGIPVVSLPESSDVVQRLLHITYPTNPSPPPSKDTLLKLCVSLDKYCVRVYPRTVLDNLVALAEDEPEIVYIFACRMRLPDVAQEAARRSLRSPTLFRGVPESEVFTISTRRYHAFVSYQHECYQQALSVVRDLSWADVHPFPPGFAYGDSEYLKYSLNYCKACSKISSRVPAGLSRTQNTAPKKKGSPAGWYWLTSWLEKYLDLVGDALQKDTCGATAINRQFIEHVLGPASTVACDGCRTAQYALAMTAFSEKLKDKIDMKILEVKLSQLEEA